MKAKPKKCKYCEQVFIPTNSLQVVCGYKCAVGIIKEKKKKNFLKMKSYLYPDKLRNKADGLFQIVGVKKFPFSIIGGEPTGVIHHFIYKSQSNNTRYDFDNAIPLTVKEHDIIHNRTKSSELELQICTIKGQEWQRRLLDKSRIICKLTNQYLEEKIKELEQYEY